jgi:hypothetical protein
VGGRSIKSYKRQDGLEVVGGDVPEDEDRVLPAGEAAQEVAKVGRAGRQDHLVRAEPGASLKWKDRFDKVGNERIDSTK